MSVISKKVIHFRLIVRENAYNSTMYRCELRRLVQSGSTVIHSSFSFKDAQMLKKTNSALKKSTWMHCIP